MATRFIGEESNEISLDIMKVLWKHKLVSKDEELQSVEIKKTEDGISVDVEKYRRKK